MSNRDNSTNKISDNDDEGFSTAAKTTKVLSNFSFSEADGSSSRNAEAECTKKVHEHSSTGQERQMSNKTEIRKTLAVALGYQPDKDNAPKVLAKGEGFIAEKIIQTALDEGIEVKKDEDLLQILKTVDIDSEIPVEAFAAVAEIISYIYQANQRAFPKPQ